MKSFLVEYAVIGSRCCGMYSARAETSEKAVELVQAVDSDYAKIVAEEVPFPNDVEHDDNVVFGCHFLDIADEDDINIPDNTVKYLGSGT